MFRYQSSPFVSSSSSTSAISSASSASPLTKSLYTISSSTTTNNRLPIVTSTSTSTPAPKPTKMFTIVNNTHHSMTHHEDANTPTAHAKKLLLPPGVSNQELKARYPFIPPTDSQLDSYTTEVVNAVRTNDLSKLESLLQQGHDLNACNRNGETLLHMACRCCSVEVVSFLIKSAKVHVNVIDSVGRSVLHDICWRHRLDIELMILLIGVIDPNLFVLPDNRGHTCFDYCRKEHYQLWINFLQENYTTILSAANPPSPTSSKDDALTKTITDGDTTSGCETSDSEDDEEEDPTFYKHGIINKEIYFQKINRDDNDDDLEVKPEKVVSSVLKKEQVRDTPRPEAAAVVPTPAPASTKPVLKRKDSSSPLDASMDPSRSIYTNSSHTNGHDDYALNEPLKKKSNSMLNLTELADEEVIASGTTGQQSPGLTTSKSCSSGLDILAQVAAIVTDRTTTTSSLQQQKQQQLLQQQTRVQLLQQQPHRHTPVVQSTQLSQHLHQQQQQASITIVPNNRRWFFYNSLAAATPAPVTSLSSSRTQKKLND